VAPVAPVGPYFPKISEYIGPVNPEPLVVVNCATRSSIIIPDGPSGPVAEIFHPPAIPTGAFGLIAGPTLINGVANPDNVYTIPS
jgi:hypothetical protein